MRVLLVAQWFPPLIGGEEAHVHRLGRALVERGHDVSVATLWQKGLEASELVDGIRVHRLRGSLQRFDRLFRDPSRKSAAPFPDPELTAGLRRIVADERPDVVHAHNWLVHSYLPIKRASPAPLVLTLHDFSLVCARKDFRQLGIRNCSGPAPAKCLRCAAQLYGAAAAIPTVGGVFAMAAWERGAVDHFVAVSHSVAEGNGLAAGGLPFSVIPNFIAEPDAAAGQAAEPGPAPDGLPDEPYLLFVGSIRRIKGVHVLLRAYAGLDRPPALVVIGYPGLKDEALPDPLPRGVTLLENVPHPSVMAAWRRSRLGIVPSISRDSSPTVVLEAMVSGTPLVASRIGGVPDLVEDGVSGILVPPGDADALRAALERVLADEALAARLGANARTRAAEFTAGRIVPRIEAVYEAAIKRASSRRR
jgi:glycosyltransferase involved in cell wall biosynthesis